MSKRQIVQITSVNETIAALCNDGSTWLLAFEFDERKRWKRLPDIPQTEPAKPPKFTKESVYGAG